MFGRQHRHRETGLRIAILGRKIFSGPCRASRLLAAGGQAPAAPAQRGLNRIGQALGTPLPDAEPVNNRLNGMPRIFVQLDPVRLGQLDDLPVHPNPHKSLAADLFDHVPELSGLAGNQGCQQEELRSVRPAQDGIGNFLRSLPGNLLPGCRVMRNPDGRVEQPEVIVNLSCRRDGGSRMGTGRALLDCDRGGKPLDIIDVRLLHLVQELPRVGGEAFDIFPLAFGEERIKCERRLPRAAQSGHHHKLVPRDPDIQVFQVVLPGSLDPDEFLLVGRHAEIVGRNLPGTAVVRRNTSAASFPRAGVRARDQWTAPLRKDQASVVRQADCIL